MYEVRHGRIQKTARSVALAERRVIAKTDTTRYRFTAQEIADERHLSRSKPYASKGKQEAARRLARAA